MPVTSRPLCVLLADVPGSGALREKLGDVEAGRAIQRCLNRIERAAAACGGRLARADDDKAMVLLFDSAEQGFLAARDMQQKIEDLPPVRGDKLAIRVAFCFGDVTEQIDDVAGDAMIIATRLLALAKPMQILTEEAAIKVLPAHCLTSVGRLGSICVKGIANLVQLWEVFWRGGEELVAVPDRFAPTQPSEFKLRLRHGEKEIFVGAKRTAMTLGRDNKSDLVIGDPRTSRRHARIELRHDRFVLIDHSTNGTYIASDADSGYAVKGDEAVLRGRGRISFGFPYQPGIADYVDYAVID
jgi:class 3 adenylate cyclase